MALLCDVNDQLQNEAGRIGQMISAKLLAKSPWNRLIEQDAFPEAMGETIQTLLYERVAVADATGTAWVDVGLNDGTGSSCNPTPQEIEYARTLKSYNLQQSAIQSPTLCVNDIRVGWKFQEQLAEQYRILDQNTRWFWENRYRDEFLRLAGNHIVADSLDPLSMSTTGSGADFALSTPDYTLEQAFLDSWYLDLVRDCAEGAYGMVDGMDQFALICSPETSFNLKTQNADIRSDIRFSGEANELLKPLGATFAYRGFYHIVDTQAPRYNFVNGAWVRVPFYIATAATTGNKYVVNPAYKSAAYEVSFIFNPKVYTSRVASAITNPGGNAKFDAVNYRGDFMWINNKDNACNKLGNQGYFYGLFMQGSQPKRTEWGYAILHQRCGTTASGYTCS